MQLITGVMYDAKPDDITVYPTSVYVIKSCKEIQVTDEQDETTRTKFECDIEVYDVNEYILNKLESQTQNDAATYDELAAALQEGVDSV